MTTYAKGTTVPTIKTRMEIEALLRKLGCEELGSAESNGTATVFFRKGNWRVQMTMRLPVLKELADAHYKKHWRSLGVEAVQKLLAQREREAWRGFLLVIKAKFAALEHGVETFEEAFMPHIVLHDGTTIGQRALPKLRELVAANQPLMPGSGAQQ